MSVNYYYDINQVDMSNIFVSPSFPNSPLFSGYIGNLVAASNIPKNYAGQLETYFVAPMTGEFIFAAVCDRIYSVYLGASQSSPRDDFKITEITAKSSGQFELNE